jgi:hypothetical protein
VVLQLAAQLLGAGAEGVHIGHIWEGSFSWDKGGRGAASGGRNLKKLENTVFLLYPISPPKSRAWGNFHEKTIRSYDMGTG